MSKPRLRLNAPHVASQVIDGEAIIIHFETGCYYSTDGVGSAIVDLIKQHASSEEIVADIARRCGRSHGDVEPAVAGFLDQLSAEGIVAGVDGGVDRVAPAEASVADGRLEFAAPSLHKYTDLQDLLLIDPIHDTDESGWPSANRRDGG